MHQQLFCVAHAEAEKLVPSAFVWDWRTVCVEHCEDVEAWQPPASHQHVALWCIQCATGGDARPAFFVVDGQSLCIRHGADAAQAEDDMGAHDMVHAAYQALGERGVTDYY
jgi:hypothetical protein